MVLQKRPRITEMEWSGRKPLKWLPRIPSASDPNLKVGENERLSFFKQPQLSMEFPIAIYYLS